MKILILFIVLLHGLIHLMGFLKSFGLAELNELTLNITKPIGVLWLFSALLFTVVAILLALNKEWWWMPAILAIILSQFLIILTWQDAKFGTISNTIILLAIVVGIAVWNFNTQSRKEINLLLSVEKATEKVIITKEMLEKVPPQVQLWLSNVGIVGKDKIHTVYLKQRGLMKLKPEQNKWSNAKAEQYVTTVKPAFIWKIDMGMIPLVNTSGRDLFMDGKGQMLIKLAYLIPVVDIANNEKLNHSTLQRYLLELPWYPTAALNSYITWESVDEYSAKATMTYNGVTGSAIFSFNKNGELEKVSALRYKDIDGNAGLLECIGEVKESIIIEGIKIPSRLNVSWVLEEGIFTWYKLEIFDVEFNSK